MSCKEKQRSSIALCFIVMFLSAIPSAADEVLFDKGAVLAELKDWQEADVFAESLSKDGVLIRSDSEYEGIYALYEGCKKKFQPLFISSDLLFHTVHRVFDYTLQLTETEQFPLLKDFSKAMLEAAVTLKKQESGHEKLMLSADQLIAYFAVANILSGNPAETDNSLKDKIDAEIQLINAHSGFAVSAVLNQKEDYSQYAVRGHYTRNETLKKYFLTSLWFGRRMFRFDETKPEGAGSPPDTPDIKGWWNAPENFPEIAKSEIISACLLVYLLENTKIEGKQAVEIYQKLKSPFDVLVGRSEDITVETLSKAVRETFKKDWKPSDLNDDAAVYAMAKKVAAENTVKIDGSGMGRKGLTLLGQRFIPDAAFFQKLVHDEKNPLYYTKKGEKGEKPFTWAADQVAGEIRGFPRGMDIMAVLGSTTAEAVLKAKGDMDYENYSNNLNALKKSYKSSGTSGYVYEKILRAFEPLFSEADKNAPAFMRSDTWKRKSLNTALGAWTELRHDTILYGKQSYSSVSRGGLMSPEKNEAYLEPNPEAYRRLSSLLSDLSKSQAFSIPDYLSGKYKAFSELLDKLAIISEKELKGSLPDRKDTDFLWNLSDVLKNELRLPQEIEDKVGLYTKSDMPLAADVHTRMPHVLTEAVGFPAKIIAVITVGNQPRLFFGGIYSYYEFKVPYENRLTDEKWKEELKAGKSDKPVLLP